MLSQVLNRLLAWARLLCGKLEYKGMYGRFCFSLALVLVLWCAALAQTAGDIEKAFEAGNQAFEAGRFEEALKYYQDCLDAGASFPSLYWNAGLAALSAGHGDQAVRFYSLLREEEPSDWRALAKLVQAYQLKGDFLARDEVRDELVEARNRAPEGSELKKAAFFCRDQFESSRRKVMAFEHFQLEGPRGVKYVFIVSKEGSSERDYRLSLGSYDATNDFMHETAQIAPGVRAYHLDGYYDGDTRHSTFGFFEGVPDYDKLRSMIEAIIAGQVRPLSGSSRNDRGDVEIQITVPEPSE